MCYGYHIWSKEALMQAENDDDLDGGQRLSEVKWGKLCAIATIFGQKKPRCKLRMMMTLMEVKGHQRSNGILYVPPIWYLVSRWDLGPKVCLHHFGCGMKWIKGYYMIVKVKNETFWFSTYSMEIHSLTSSSFIICLWGETFGSRTILFYNSRFLARPHFINIYWRFFFISLSLSLLCLIKAEGRKFAPHMFHIRQYLHTVIVTLC